MILLDGVRLSDSGKYEFCKSFDLQDDLILLSKDVSGITETNSLSYFYAYEFNPDATRHDVESFRHALKNSLDNQNIFDMEDIHDFVMFGLLRLDKHIRLDKFKVAVMSESSKTSTVLTILDSLLYEHLDGEITTLKLIKNLCRDVVFDRERARTALENTEKYRGKKKAIEHALDNIERQFHSLQGTNKAFKMKLYSPVVARIGFTNIFRFKTQEQEDIYRQLESGTNVLLCDDFITSGSTVKEMQDVLNSINPNNKLTVFILINQLRNY